MPISPSRRSPLPATAVARFVLYRNAPPEQARPLPRSLPSPTPFHPPTPAPLNRSRMMAPFMTAFSAGTVVGPALGGWLAGAIGVGPAVCCVGGVFFFNAMVTRFVMVETMPQPPPQPPSSQPPSPHDLPSGSPPAPSMRAAGVHGGNTEGGGAAARGAGAGWGRGVYVAVRETLSQWRPVLAHPELRAVVTLHSAYWACMAGALLLWCGSSRWRREPHPEHLPRTSREPPDT